MNEKMSCSLMFLSLLVFIEWKNLGGIAGPNCYLKCSDWATIKKNSKRDVFHIKLQAYPILVCLQLHMKLCGVNTVVYRTHRSLNISIEGQVDCPSGLSGLGLDFVELKKH